MLFPHLLKDALPCPRSAFLHLENTHFSDPKNKINHSSIYDYSRKIKQRSQFSVRMADLTYFPHLFKVKAINNMSKNIRNVAIIAHVDHGKRL